MVALSDLKRIRALKSAHQDAGLMIPTRALVRDPRVKHLNAITSRHSSRQESRLASETYMFSFDENIQLLSHIDVFVARLKRIDNLQHARVDPFRTVASQ